MEATEELEPPALATKDVDVDVNVHADGDVDALVGSRPSTVHHRSSNTSVGSVSTVTVLVPPISTTEPSSLSSPPSSSPSPASSPRRHPSRGPVDPPSVSPASKATSTLRVFVGSWNVGNAMPPKRQATLSAWIPLGGGGFDVLAIGLQESSYREKSASETERESTRRASRISAEAAASAAALAEMHGQGESPEQEDDDEGEEEEEEEEEEEDGEEDGDDDDEDGDGEDDGEEDEDGEEDQGAPEEAGDDRPREQPSPSSAVAVAPLPAESGDVMVTKPRRKKKKKRLRAKKSIRKVSRLVRQLYLHLGAQYALVGKVELMEMRLFVYVHVKHSVSQIEKLSVPTGIGSVLGNKGGLIFKCVVQNTSLCFVSCHLAAHQDQKFLDKRNSDCASILAGHVGLRHVPLDCQFDHCFWFGDLNYRVDLNYASPRADRSHAQHFDEVLAHVRAKNWTLLNANDQLRHQIDERRALMGWELLPAKFPPTFKRVRHTTDQFNPQRVPSYCDRVLHKSLPALRRRLKCQSFQCVESIATSDHKPVRATFCITTTPRLSTTDLVDGSNGGGGGSSGRGSPLRRRLGLRRRTPSAAAEAGMLTAVEIQGLAATDLLGMDMSGLSDPYVKFYSIPEFVLQREANGSSPTTATIMNTLSPSWRDEQVPTLSLLCATEQDARNTHLVLLFMDYDATSADDMLGVVVLALDRFCLARPRFVPFEADVVRHGKPAGRVTGKLRVCLPHQREAVDKGHDAERDAAPVVRPGCQCCLS
ncbi:hypothetical protein PINS_up002283 [Pythium insidiosum]|nr:hypothetical protein PINS_up002283 [Pythium insidiosum]